MQVLPISPKSPESGQQQGEFLVHGARKLPKPRLLFIMVVVLPVLASILYYGFLASDVYVSESQFVIRSPQKPTQSPLGAILQTAGFSNASDEADAAQSFAVSRDALRALNQDRAFEKAYTRPSISIIDRFNPLGLRGSFERLYRYFNSKVSLNQNSATNTLVLQVKAYDPQDAYRFNQRLLDLTEATVNRLNARGRHDLIQYAQAEVDMAKARSQTAALALAAYRNRSGVVDPQMEAQAQMQMISSLQNLRRCSATHRKIREYLSFRRKSARSSRKSKASWARSPEAETRSPEIRCSTSV
jgi:capsular polysaccharide transport system permease protein